MWQLIYFFKNIFRHRKPGNRAGRGGAVYLQQRGYVEGSVKSTNYGDLGGNPLVTVLVAVIG